MCFKLNKIIRKPIKKVNWRSKGADLGRIRKIRESMLFDFTVFLSGSLFFPGACFPRSNGFAPETAFS